MDDVFARYQSALRTGHQLAAEGRFKEALAQYEQAARVADERALPHLSVGGMLLRMGRAKDALAAYERALAREPSNLDALSGRAAALLAAGRRSEAAAAQHQIAALRAAPPAGSGVPVEMHTPLSRAETLAVAAEQALDAGQRDAAIDAWLAEAREHAHDGHFDAAINAAMRPLTLDPNSARVPIELARLDFERGRRDDGERRVAMLRRLLEIAPDDATAHSLDELEREFAEAEENR